MNITTELTSLAIPFVNPNDGFVLQGVSFNQMAFLRKLFNNTGQFMRVDWKRDVKVRVAYKGTNLTKLVRGVFRAGINYDHKASVIDKRESGELPEENAGLPWGKWFAFPYLVVHKGNLYVRLYPTENCKVESYYYLDDEVVSFDSIKHMVLASEYAKEERPETITVRLDSIC